MRHVAAIHRLTPALFRGCSKHEESFTDLRPGALLHHARMWRKSRPFIGSRNSISYDHRNAGDHRKAGRTVDLRPFLIALAQLE